MGITKSNLFSERQNSIATIAKAFAHPARIAIIEHLTSANTCITSDLVQELGLAQATVSQHLRELKDVGLITGTIEGSRMCYCIDKGRWKEVETAFSKLFADPVLPKNPGCC